MSFRLLGPLSCCLVALALLGCQAPRPADPPAVAALGAAPSAGGTASGSAALAFVAAAQPGQSKTVSDPAFGGMVLIEIEAQYHSASNLICRRFTVSRLITPVRRQTKFACFTNAGLELVDIY